jgi:RNA-directed DNA polymerase
MTTRDADVPVEIPGAAPEGSGRKPPEHGSGASNVTATREPSWTEAERGLMEDVVSRPNMMAALGRVEANKGAPGIDEMTTGELRGVLKERWPIIREELLDGRYRPQPVRKVEIEKPDGGTRTLGIPTVCDRLIQQALHQVLTPQGGPLSPFCRTSCSTSSTRNWRGAVMPSAGTPTTATSRCRPGAVASGSWPVSAGSWRSDWH